MATITTSKTFSTDSIMNSYGIPESVWRPIQQVESGGNPNAYVKTSKEESVGLFQLNRLNGLGVGYSVTQLKDPVLNATIAAKKMSPIVKEGQAKGLTGYALTKYVAANGGWPTQAGVGAMPTTYDTKLFAAYGGTSGNSTVNNSGGISTSYPGSNVSNDSSWNLLDLGFNQLSAAFWLVVGLIIVFIGIKLMTNPLADLTSVISRVNFGGVTNANNT